MNYHKGRDYYRHQDEAHSNQVSLMVPVLAVVIGIFLLILEHYEAIVSFLLNWKG